MKTSEKRLALIMGGLVVIFLVVLSVNYYRQQRAQLVQQRSLLVSSAQEQNIWLRQSELWLDRDRWVRTHQPSINSPRSATADLFSQLEQMAGEAGVKIEKSRLFDPVEVEGFGFVEIGVQLTMDASLESLITWAAKIQDPAKFRLFKRFTLNSQDDVPTMKLDCMVVQWCVTSDRAETETVEVEIEAEPEQAGVEPVADEKTNETTETTEEGQ